jgi:glucose uptake protein GlcU
MWGIFVCLIPAIGYGCMAPFATKVGGSTQQKTLFITLACLMVGLIVMFCEIPFGLDYLSKAGLFYFALSIISGFC